jgi:hypothetical protein
MATLRPVGDVPWHYEASWTADGQMRAATLGHHPRLGARTRTTTGVAMPLVALSFATEVRSATRHDHVRHCTCSHTRFDRTRPPAPLACLARLASIETLAQGGAVRPPLRGCLERRDRQRLRGRASVPSRDLDVRRRRGPVERPLGLRRYPPRAALPGLARVEAGRRVVARVEHRRTLRPQVTIDLTRDDDGQPVRFVRVHAPRSGASRPAVPPLHQRRDRGEVPAAAGRRLPGAPPKPAGALARLAV